MTWDKSKWNSPCASNLHDEKRNSILLPLPLLPIFSPFSLSLFLSFLLSPLSLYFLPFLIHCPSLPFSFPSSFPSPPLSLSFHLHPPLFSFPPSFPSSSPLPSPILTPSTPPSLSLSQVKKMDPGILENSTAETTRIPADRCCRAFARLQKCAS